MMARGQCFSLLCSSQGIFEVFHGRWKNKRAVNQMLMMVIPAQTEGLSHL